MANPIQFKARVDPKKELAKQLDAAPYQDAEAMLIVYDILRTAHENGTLGLIQGLVGGRDMIAGELAKYARMPGGINAIRNVLALSKILMAFDPETLDAVTKEVTSATGQHRTEDKPPSLWAITRRVFSADSLRALSFLTLMLQALGRSLAPTAGSKHE